MEVGLQSNVHPALSFYSSLERRGVKGTNVSSYPSDHEGATRGFGCSIGGRS